MEIYIEKDFLDFLYVNDSSKVGRKKVLDFFCNYTDVTIYIDQNFSAEDFKAGSESSHFSDNPILNDLRRNGSARIISLSNSLCDHLFENSNFHQTLVFTLEDQKWLETARNKGAMCFSADTFEDKIEEIINNLHFDYSLNDPFRGWDILAPYKLINFNSLSVSDDYILVDSGKQLIKDNIIPLLEKLILKRKETIEINILTGFKENSKPIEYKRKKLNQIYCKLISTFGNENVSFEIINRNLKSNFNFHARTLVTNFSILKSDDGFNLVPPKLTDGDLSSRTIFDLYSYKKIMEIRKKQKEYIEAILSPEFGTIDFKIIP